MPLVTSANIACGGHAGNENTMRAPVELAMKNHVAIGPHPGNPDRERFGRLARALGGALIPVRGAAAARALSFARRGGVCCADGTSLKLDVDTLCSHGDTPGAADIARAVRDAFRNANVKVASFKS